MVWVTDFDPNDPYKSGVADKFFDLSLNDKGTTVAAIPAGTYRIDLLKKDSDGSLREIAHGDTGPEIVTLAPGEEKTVTLNIPPEATTTTVAPPILTLHEPSTSPRIAVGNKLPIVYSVTSPDGSPVTTTFKATTFTPAFTPAPSARIDIQIDSCTTTNVGDHLSCSWDTTGSKPGVYIIDAASVSGTGTPVVATAPSTITLFLPTPVSFAFTSPSNANSVRGAFGSPLTVKYNFTDSFTTTKAQIYYDTDNTGADGVAVSGTCANPTQGTNQSCTWTNTSVAPGLYYLYASIAPTVVYSTGPAWILPGTPTTLKATSTIAKQVQLTWTDTTALGSTGTFEIYRLSPAYRNYTLIGTYSRSNLVNLNANSTIDKTVTSGATYSYKVRAYQTLPGGQKLYSDDSNQVTLKVR